MKLSSLLLATIIAFAAGACGSDNKGGADAAAGSAAGGTTGGGGRGGTTGAGGTTGSAGTTGGAGTTGSAGATGSAGTTGAGGGTQPVGAACVNSGMCSQADGPAVCCLQISTCVLQNQCPGTPTYVSCETMPCEKAGWICCNSGGMRFCTKQSGCPGSPSP